MESQTMLYSGLHYTHCRPACIDTYDVLHMYVWRQYGQTLVKNASAFIKNVHSRYCTANTLLHLRTLNVLDSRILTVQHVSCTVVTAFLDTCAGPAQSHMLQHYS